MQNTFAPYETDKIGVITSGVRVWKAEAISSGLGSLH